MRNFGGYSKLTAGLAFRNLVRNRAKSVLAGLVGVLTVFMLVIYAGNIESAMQQLVSLPEVIEIPAQISNLNGEMNAGLAIKEQNLEGILASKEVKDVVCTVQLKIGLGEFSEGEWEGNLNYFGAGINDIAGVPGFKAEEVLFLEQMDESVLQSEEPVCIMDVRVMEANGVAMGDLVMLNLYYYQYGNPQGSRNEVLIKPLSIGEYRVVGKMDIMEYSGSVVQPDIILPFGNVREIFHEKGIDFTADSLSFTVKDPFRLNECKADMHEIGLLPVAKDADFRFEGNALTMKDDIFINAAENLRESLAILTGIRPFVVVMILFIGYLCSYLLIQGRRTEYATMRSVGMGWGGSFLVMFMENIMIETAACVLASVAALFVANADARAVLWAAGVFLGAFLAGSGAALWSFRSLSVMEALSRGD